MKTTIYGLLIAVAIFGAGCAGQTPATTAEKTVSGVSVTVEVALGAWDQFVKAGKSTVAQEQQVKAAYAKYQAAFSVMCDAGATWSASENTTNAGPATAGYEYAAQNVSNELNDVENLLHSFGVTF